MVRQISSYNAISSLIQQGHSVEGLASALSLFQEFVNPPPDHSSDLEDPPGLDDEDGAGVLEDDRTDPDIEWEDEEMPEAVAVPSTPAVEYLAHPDGRVFAVYPDNAEIERIVERSLQRYLQDGFYHVVDDAPHSPDKKQ